MFLTGLGQGGPKIGFVSIYIPHELFFVLAAIKYSCSAKPVHVSRPLTPVRGWLSTILSALPANRGVEAQRSSYFMIGRRVFGNFISLLDSWHSGDNGLASAILSAKAMEMRLAEERSRSERSQRCFSMLLFKVLAPQHTPAQHAALKALLNALNEQTRSIDIKGWMGSQIGLILPYTNPAQSEKVYAKVNDAYRKQAGMTLHRPFALPELQCIIQVYPKIERTISNQAS